MEEQKGSPLNNMSPSKMFVSGIVVGVLVLCTIGFFILLGMVLKGDGIELGGEKGSAKVANNNGTTTPTPRAPSKSNAPAVGEDDHIRGAENAKITLIEYSDFECPFCGRFHPTVKQVLEDYPNDVRIVYRHFPLSFHPEAQPAAEASECAAEQGKFWEFHDGIFDNQARIGSSLYTELAGGLGLNMTQFNDCVSSGKYTSKVTGQQSGGSLAGVGGTPHTIVIGPDGNTVPLSGALPYSQVKSTIDSMLN